MFFYTEIDEKCITTQGVRILRALGSEGFIAGGYARYIYRCAFSRPETALPPGDIDVFGCHGDVSHLLTPLGYKVSPKKTPHSWQLNKIGGGVPVQVIFPEVTDYGRQVGTPAEVLAQFDFIGNMFAVQYVDRRFVCTYEVDAPIQVDAGVLTIQAIDDPIAMVARIAKYARKGFRISLGEITRLFETWESRPPAYRTERLAFYRDLDGADVDYGTVMAVKE